MFDFSLFYVEFDPTIGPKIERSQSSQTNINLEFTANLKKSNSLFTIPKYIDFINSEPIRLARRGSKKFSAELDKIAKVVQNNAFPESIKQLSHSKPHFFTFTFNQDQLANNLNDNYYCYSIYLSIPDQKMKRKYHQFSYVIVTKLNNPSLFKELLLSTFNSFRLSYQQHENELFEDEISRCTYEIFDVLFSFLKQWQEIISTSVQNFQKKASNDKCDFEKIDLPLIDGSIKTKISKVKSKKIEICEIQEVEATSLFNALNLDKIKMLDQLLFQNSSTHNSNSTFSLYNETLKLIWESIVLNKNILVLGSTPGEASEAVFAFSSLIKEIKSFIVPYISVTDERFMQLIKYPRIQSRFPIIVGVSNPISEFLISNPENDHKSFFDFVYYVGFDDKVGFKQMLDNKLYQSFDCKSQAINLPENFAIIKKFDVYTAKFLKAIDQSLVEMSKNDFSSLFIGQINITLFSNTLLSNKIKISKYLKNQFEHLIRMKQQSKQVYDIFAEQLVNTQLFINERKHFFYFSEVSQCSLIDEKVVNGMISIIDENNIDLTNKSVNDKIESDFCSSGSEDNEMETKNFNGNRPMAKKVFNVYIHALKNSVNEDIKKKLRKALKEITNYTNSISH